MSTNEAPLHRQVAEVTARIRERSSAERDDYLAHMDAATEKGPTRSRLSCTNLAHGFAASDTGDSTNHTLHLIAIAMAAD